MFVFQQKRTVQRSAQTCAMTLLKRKFWPANNFTSILLSFNFTQILTQESSESQFIKTRLDRTIDLMVCTWNIKITVHNHYRLFIISKTILEEKK